MRRHLHVSFFFLALMGVSRTLSSHLFSIGMPCTQSLWFYRFFPGVPCTDPHGSCLSSGDVLVKCSQCYAILSLSISSLLSYVHSSWFSPSVSVPVPASTSCSTISHSAGPPWLLYHHPITNAEKRIFIVELMRDMGWLPLCVSPCGYTYY